MRELLLGLVEWEDRRFRRTLLKEGLLLPEVLPLIIGPLLYAEISFTKLILILESALHPL